MDSKIDNRKASFKRLNDAAHEALKSQIAISDDHSNENVSRISSLASIVKITDMLVDGLP